MTRALGSVTIFPSIMKLYSNDAKSVRSSASSHTSPIRYFGSNGISSHGFFSPGLYKSSRTSPARPCTRMWTPFSSCVTPSGYRILLLFRYSAILKSPVFPDIFYFTGFSNGYLRSSYHITCSSAPRSAPPDRLSIPSGPSSPRAALPSLLFPSSAH